MKLGNHYVKISLSASTPKDFVPSSGDAVATHGRPGMKFYSLPLAWEKPLLKPRAVPVRIAPLPGVWRMENQPAAFRGFGINE